MSAGIAFTRSPAQAFLKSPVQARGTFKAASTHQTVIALAPCWGFGTFSGYTIGVGIFPDVIPTYNNTWPSPLYKTLTETYTTTGGGYPPFTRVIVSTWPDYWDLLDGTNGFNQTDSNPYYTELVTGITSSTVTDTTIHIDYVNPADPSFLTTYYDAVLSDPVDDWATLTANAMTLLSHVSIPAGPTDSSYVVYAISTSPGWSSAATTSTGGAAYGLPVAAFIGHSFSPLYIMELAAGIFDDPTGYNPANINFCQGAVMCAKSTWQLNGADHNIVYAQAVTTVASPSTFATPIYATSANGVTIPGPNGEVPPCPSTLTFVPTDIAANLGGGYGQIGFVNPPD